MIVRFVPPIFTITRDRHAISAATAGQIRPLLSRHFIETLRFSRPLNRAHPEIVSRCRIGGREREFQFQQRLPSLPIRRHIPLDAIACVSSSQPDPFGESRTRIIARHRQAHSRRAVFQNLENRRAIQMRRRSRDDIIILNFPGGQARAQIVKKIPANRRAQQLPAIEFVENRSHIAGRIQLNHVAGVLDL